MEEGDRIPLRLDWKIYYFLETVHWTFWLVSIPNGNYFKFWIIMLHQTLSWSWWRVVSRAEVPDIQRDVEKWAHVFVTNIKEQWFISCVAGWMKGKSRGDIRWKLMRFYGAPLMAFCKAILKDSMSIWTHTHTHTTWRSTHILLTFQLPVHANLSISD